MGVSESIPDTILGELSVCLTCSLKATINPRDTKFAPPLPSIVGSTGLKDRQAVRAIALRIARAEAGHLGDTKPVGGGVSEMRIFVGKGYRLYFAIRSDTLMLLLNGGTKGTKGSKKQQQLDYSVRRKFSARSRNRPVNGQ